MAYYLIEICEKISDLFTVIVLQEGYYERMACNNLVFNVSYQTQ